MFKYAKPFFIRTISPMHVGSGSDLGIVDLPIQREKHTGFPKIEASSLKGSIREALENISEEKKEKLLKKKLSEETGENFDLIQFGAEAELIHNYSYALNLVFGYDDDGLDEKVRNKFKNNTEFAGAIGFSDAKILLFPVKSAKGIFAWITSFQILKQLIHDLNLAKVELEPIAHKNINNDEAIVANREFISINGNVILEEYSFNITEENSQLSELLAKLTGIEEIKDRLVIIDDDSFKDFVNLSTEVITRTKIDNTTGTVARGALFNEEYLPAESIMYFTVFTSPIFQKEENMGIFKGKINNQEKLVFEFFRNSLPEVIQIGGNATLGKGLVEIKEVNDAK